MKEELLQKIETAKSPDFGNLLSKSIDLFKKIWMDSFLHLLVTFLAIIPVILLVYLPFIPAFIRASESNDFSNLEPDLDFSIIAIVGLVIAYFIVIVIAQMITIAITAHFFKVCKIKDYDSNEDAGGYFSYLKGGNFGKVMMLSIATFGIAIAALLLCIIPIYYVMVPLQLIVVIFAFNDKLSVSDIISLSFKLGNKFWLLLFGLIIVSGFIAQIGIFLCFIGVFFTAYFTHIPIYYFYKETIGFGEVTRDSAKDFNTHYNN